MILLLLSVLVAGVAISFLDFGSDSDESGGSSGEELDRESVNLTAGDDTFQGTGLAEQIFGFDGNDSIRGGGGPDLLMGGDGADYLNGEAGSDILYGGSDNDAVNGGDGDDQLFLGDGVDKSVAFEHQGGNDFIRGGDGRDTITDTLGSNTVYGDLGGDTISTVDNPGEFTPDTVYGGFGPDVITVDGGDDVSLGGGLDSLIVDLTYNDVDDTLEEIVNVTDFDVTEDILQVYFDATPATANDVIETVTYVDGNVDGVTGTMLQLDGKDVAFIAGQTETTMLTATVVVV